MTSIGNIREALAATAPDYGIASASLFGSYARGDQTAGSDVDIVVELARPLGFRRAAFAQALQDRLGVAVDVIFGADQLYAPVRTSYERERVSVYEG